MRIIFQHLHGALVEDMSIGDEVYSPGIDGFLTVVAFNESGEALLSGDGRPWLYEWPSNRPGDSRPVPVEIYSTDCARWAGWVDHDTRHVLWGAEI